MKKTRPFLGDQLLKSTSQLKKYLQSLPQLEKIIEKLNDLVKLLEQLRTKVDNNKLNEALQNIVRKCSEIAESGNVRSLEDYTRSLGLPALVHESPPICQIDKLARYLFLCKDLIRIARKPEYNSLFNSIKITHLNAFPGIARPCMHEKCFVHAEMQQVIHYEKQPHQPTPRAIGCSKSACFLCNLLILKQGRFRISHSHGRLYQKWTLPDVDWMSQHQALLFRAILQEMIRELKKAAMPAMMMACSMPYPMESRAFLPLSSGSTLSKATTIVPTPLGPDGNLLRSPSSPQAPRCVCISSKDLPFHQTLQNNQAPFIIEIDMVSLFFEFMCKSTVQLCISHVCDPSMEALRIINMFDIPTKTEMEILCTDETSRVCFQLCGNSLFVDIEFLWI
jgi:hypothetical protein